MPDSLEILQERLASLEQQLQDYGNRTRRLEIDIPKGMMLPYFSNNLPESGDYVWADGQTKWPEEPWVPEHLQGKPVPDMREQLVGGAKSPGDNTVGLEWSGGMIPISASMVSGSNFKLQPATPVTQPVSGNGARVLRLATVGMLGEPLALRGLVPNTELVLGRGMEKPGPGDNWGRIPTVDLFFNAPSIDEVRYTDTRYPETLTGEAQINAQVVKLADASTNPRHLRANWIIRVK